MKTEPDWQFASTEQPERWTRTNLVVRGMLFLVIIDLIVICAAPVSRLYLDMPGLQAFLIMLFAILLGLALAFIALIIFFFSIIKKISPAGKNSLAVFLIGIIPTVTVVTVVGPGALRSPPIHDISTDTSTPPEFQEVLRLRNSDENSLDYPGASLAVIQEQAYPDIQPIKTRLNRVEALDEATRVVKDLQWEFVNVDYDQGIIEAYDTTTIFGFVDDIIIRVQSDGEGSQIDIRSASRVGQGDLGKNAERIRKFITTFRG